MPVATGRPGSGVMVAVVIVEMETGRDNWDGAALLGMGTVRTCSANTRF